MATTILTDEELDAYRNQSCDERPPDCDLYATALHYRALARRMARALLASRVTPADEEPPGFDEAWALLGIKDRGKSTIAERVAALRDEEPEHG